MRKEEIIYYKKKIITEEHEILRLKWLIKDCKNRISRYRRSIRYLSIKPYKMLSDEKKQRSREASQRYYKKHKTKAIKQKLAQKIAKREEVNKLIEEIK